MLFRFPTAVVAMLVAVAVIGAAVAGTVVGRRFCASSDKYDKPAATIQASLLGFVGLLLAFGLSMAVGRYEARRAAVVTEANAIGTAYLRATLLPEPERTTSLAIWRDYLRQRLAICDALTDTPRFDAILNASRAHQAQLWEAAGQVASRQPVENVPRLYLEAVNAVIDADTGRVAALTNHIPTTVIWLQVAGASAAVSALGFSLGVLGRGPVGILVVSALVSTMLMAMIDLDRPSRGLVVISCRPLTAIGQTLQQD